MSRVKVTGQDQLNKELEKRFGKEAMQKRVDAALVKGANAFKKELQKEFNRFKDTGASLGEITISKPLTLAGKRTIKVHWRGPKNRYRIIHLNEFGTIRNPNPRGKGAVARAEKAARNEYMRIIKDELGRG